MIKLRAGMGWRQIDYNQSLSRLQISWTQLLLGPQILAYARVFSLQLCASD